MRRRIRRWYGPPIPSRYRVALVSTDPTRYLVIDTRTGRTVARMQRLSAAYRLAIALGLETR